MNPLIALLVLLAAVGARPLAARQDPPIVGRWDMTVRGNGWSYPAWLEIKVSGYQTLVGRFVGGGGSARPISHVIYEGGRCRFTIPVQWEEKTGDVMLDGALAGDSLVGTITGPKGDTQQWTAVRAPRLYREQAPRWGAPIELFNGRDLSGWHARSAGRKNGWTVRDGILVNADPGNDLVTYRKFDDFKVHVEFRYPADSNSGLYLRGRYEVQITDDFGKEPEEHLIGAVYGFLAPRVIAARRAGEWQTMDVTLVGREVTVVLNGQEVICRTNIPGITGGALDSEEGAPGPILIQGDHGPIEFRNVTLIPARSAAAGR